MIRNRSKRTISTKKARRGVIDVYKRLKSQYDFLCRKFGLNRRENGSDSRAYNQDLASSPGNHPLHIINTIPSS